MLNQRREALAQRALMNRLEPAVARRFRVELGRAIREAAEEFRTQGNILSAMHSHRLRLEAILSDTYRTTATVFGRRMIALLSKQSAFDRFDAAALLFIRANAARKVVDIGQTTEEEIREGIERGIVEGLGQRSVADAIAESARVIAPRRAKVIARTEVHTASQWSQLEAARETQEELGRQVFKVWGTTLDERSRTLAEGAEFDHVAMNGEAIPLEERFRVPGVRGDDYIDFPGDPTGQAGNIINCRCVQSYQFVGG